MGIPKSIAKTKLYRCVMKETADGPAGTVLRRGATVRLKGARLAEVRDCVETAERIDG